jgi:hypothetical protein
VTDDVLLTLSLLLMGALLARFVASLIGIPEILVLVAIGALFGPFALDVVDVPFESLGAQLMFTLGVSLILFYGGLSLSLPVLRRVAVTLGLLAVPGMLLTAAVVGVAARFAFDLPWDVALLVGAVLAPTDPAILIPLFIRSRLKPKLVQTVIAESAFNDPTGAALALTLAGVVLTGSDSITGPAGEFLVDLGISTVIGIVAGVVLAAAISSHRMGIWRESAAIAVLTVVTISFFSLDTAGGSGYLGAFLAGLIVGNMEHLGLGEGNQPHVQEVRHFAFNLAGHRDPDRVHGARREHPVRRVGRQPAPGPRRAGHADAGGEAAHDLRAHDAGPRSALDAPGAGVPVLDEGRRAWCPGAGGRLGRVGRAGGRRVRLGGGAGDRADAAAAGASGALAGRPPGPARAPNPAGRGGPRSRVMRPPHPRRARGLGWRVFGLSGRVLARTPGENPPHPPRFQGGVRVYGAHGE